jgi:hypothetical protein
MKNLTILFLIFTVFGCQISKEPSPIVGTWNKCFRDGEYREYKIGNNHTLMLTMNDKGISLFKNKIENDALIISGVNDSLPNNTDTLTVISYTNDIIVLKSKFTKVEFELNKIENAIKKIDSTNIDEWKDKTLQDFQQRAGVINCPDLRTEKEKRKPKRHWKIAF